MTEVLTYESLKADRDAQQKRADALSVENQALKESSADLRRQAFNGRRNSHNCGPFQYSDLCESIIEATKTEIPATDAAIAAIEARGVEKLIESKLNQLANMHPDTHAFGATADAMRTQITWLQAFAIELREAK